MATYLIDYENVHHHGLHGIEKLTSDDYVVLFVGSKDKTISVDSAISISKSNANIIWKKAEKTAPNYLDIQIASYLGLLIGENRGTDFYIVSKDKGFIAATDFWTPRKPNMKIAMLETISGKPIQKISKQVDAPTKSPDPVSADEKIKPSIKKSMAAVLRAHNLIGGNYTKVHALFIKSKTEQQFLSAINGAYRGYDKLGEDLLPVFKDYLSLK